MSEQFKSVTCLDGFTVSIGDEVEFWGEGTHGMAIVREITGDRVLLDPIEGQCEILSSRWWLNPQAAEHAGREDHWMPRDKGVSFGCLKRPEWQWSPIVPGG